MGKPTTKSESILLEAHNRISGAQAAVSLAERALEVARASLDAHREAFNALEKALVSKPRKKSIASTPMQTPLPTEETGPMCNICHHGEDYMDHLGPSPNRHDFEPPKSVARAQRKSKQKVEATSSDQSSETMTEDAGVVALAASGGD